MILPETPPPSGGIQDMSMPPFAEQDGKAPACPPSQSNSEQGGDLSEPASSGFAGLAAPPLSLGESPGGPNLLSVFNKRGPDSEESSQNAKKGRFEERATLADAGQDAFPLGSSWGPNVAVEPSTNVNHVLRMLAGGNPGGGMTASPNLLDHSSMMRAELSAQYAQEQAARSAVIASLSRPNIDALLGPTHVGLPWNGFQRPGINVAGGGQHAQLAALRSIQLADLESFRRSTGVALNLQQPSSVPYGFHQSQGGGADRQDLSALLRQFSTAGTSSMSPQYQDFGVPTANTAGQASLSSDSVTPASRRSLDLPPCEEGRVEHFYKRPMCPLGIDEDPNWLSEFHCFVRADLVEVFRASHEDVKARNNSITYHQVGIRCRFCAHMTPSARAGRSSAFPSSLRQIYQSFTMMLRDHFGNCDAMPTHTLEKFMALKDKPAQGATDSKRFWMYSAMKVGMTDSSDGIMISERTRAAGATAPPFGTSPGQQWEDDTYRNVSLVLPSDRTLISEFLFVLLSQVQLIRLTEAERIGNRRSLRVGLPGFGCRYCCENRRLGLCRMFPARRRTLPSKVNDLYDHVRRCTVCPESVKQHLERTKHQAVFHTDQGNDREFFDRIWSRLGHGNQVP